MIRVTVWNEYRKEFMYKETAELFPARMHNFIADFLKDDDIVTQTAWLDQEDNGITDELLENTDVLIWWSHGCWQEVKDEIAEKVKKYVLNGMGFIALHSAHTAKPFTKLMGTTCSLRWREDSRERLWCCNPAHPIAKGIPEYVDIKVEEMYGEFFDIPTPDDIVFLGWFNSGEAIRAGVTFTRGLGKIFYFQPGHETYPTYQIPEIQQIIRNAVRWCAPDLKMNLDCRKTDPLEEV